MGHWVNNEDEEYYQFDDQREMAAHFGIDIDTMDGDYAEAFHYLTKYWNQVKVDVRFKTE